MSLGHFLKRIIGLSCVLAALAATPALAQPAIERVRFGVEPERTRVVIESSAPLSYSMFTLANDGDRLVVDLARVEWRLAGAPIGRSQVAAPGEGMVDRVRFAHKSATTSRIVFDLNAPVEVRRHFQLEPDTQAPRHRLVLDLDLTSRDAFQRAAGFPELAPEVPGSGALSTPPHPTDERIVVVLDAGHGGKDPGAIGPSGLQEKKVVLDTTERLKAALEATGRYDVVLTRTDDTYLTLNDRVRVAREAQADLFISVHADAAPATSSANGPSVYTLAERAVPRTRREILPEQNWLIDVDLHSNSDEVNQILIDLAQRDTQNQSSAFAQTLIPELKKVGPVLRNTHRSAGFYVLLAPDVPAVLVELGFLTNRDDARKLATPEHRERMAGAIAAAVDRYFETRARQLAAR